ncbi:FkbM family methyltransferase [Asticcacaulis taihuensis]|uniref:FkbM family methyltransferase n=1 Tax=Asticcacaulis taihuensis TaxID=260084 RepID=UPI003F7C822F
MTQAAPLLPVALGNLDFNDMEVQTWLKIHAERKATRDVLKHPLILLGAGSVLAQPFVNYTIAHGKVLALIDNARAGQTLHGIPYVGDAALPNLLAKTPEAIGVLCCGSENAIAYFTGAWGERPQPLLSYFDVLSQLPPEAAGHRLGFMPSFSDPDLAMALHEKAKAVFTDALSRQTLDAIMLYRLTWDSRYIAAIARPEKAIYFELEAMPLGEHEILVDGGAYDGDTVRSFSARTKGRYDHIHAFEIDPVNADAFTFKTQEMPNVTLHRVGLWNEKTQMGIEHRPDDGSRISKTSTIMVPLDAMDNLDLGPVSVIKLDVEGAEVHALQGARKLIASHKSKLAISAYHRADDFQTLLDTLSDLRDDYRLTLRHYSPIIYDTVIYAL